MLSTVGNLRVLIGPWGGDPGSCVSARHMSYTEAFREEVETLGKERWAARRIMMTAEIGGGYI